MAEKIGFIGVGRMGGNMARRLKECGYEIATVYDVNTEAAQGLAQELGCPAAGGLELVTSLCDVVFTVVTDDRAMKQIGRAHVRSHLKRWATVAAQGRGEELGCPAAGGLELVASLCDVVFTAVTDDRAMK